VTGDTFAEFKPCADPLCTSTRSDGDIDMPNLLRRTAILTGAAALLTAASRHVAAQPAAVDPVYPFTVPPLPYAFTANEPSIDAITMELHHDKHHAAYVSNLNAAVKDHPEVAAMRLTEMLAKLNELPEGIRAAVRNNGGGHANHSMFWSLMGGKGGEPQGALAAAINRDFVSFAQLKTDFNKAGLTQFGSGWAMVIVDRGGKLSVANRPNQDTPLIEGRRVLFANDVWEHAYYLKYQNRRADYLAAWWNVLNWSAIEARYTAATAGSLAV
jgi:Fe-Mn family superoxide dismutase